MTFVLYYNPKYILCSAFTVKKNTVYIYGSMVPERSLISHVTVLMKRLTLSCTVGYCMNGYILPHTCLAHFPHVLQYSSVHVMASWKLLQNHTCNSVCGCVPLFLISNQGFGHMARNEVWSNLVCSGTDYGVFITFLPLGDWRGSGEMYEDVCLHDCK